MAKSSPMTGRPTLSKAAENELIEAWRRCMGQAPGQLHDDLTRLLFFFDPRLNAGQLLKRLNDVPRFSARHTELLEATPPLIMLVGGRTLVTPEGRLALAPTTEEPVTEVTSRLYRDWAMARVQELAAAADGRGEEIWPTTMAVILALLATDAVGEANGWHLTSSNRPALRDAMRPVLVRMHELLGRRQGTSRNDFDGYPLSKARRRLGGDLRREPERRLPARVWLADDAAAERAARALIFELRRRRGHGTAASRRILDQTLEALHAQRQALDGQGITLGDAGRLQHRLDRAFAADDSTQQR